MKIRSTSTKLVVTVAALLLLATTIAAITQRSTPPVTRATVCVKDNVQLRMVTDKNNGCGPSEQQMDWVVGGEVTDVRVGAGLVGNRVDGIVNLALDPSVIETCGSCDGGKVFAGFNDGPGNTPSGSDAPGHGDFLPLIGSLPLPRDVYVVTAKLWVSNTTDQREFVRCRLTAGVDFDWAEVTVRERDSAALTLTVVHDFSAADTSPVVYVGCSDNVLGSGSEWNDLKIVAIKVSDISNVFLGGN